MRKNRNLNKVNALLNENTSLTVKNRFLVMFCFNLNLYSQCKIMVSTAMWPLQQTCTILILNSNSNSEYPIFTRILNS